jgi:hypothetical protein
LTSTTLFRNVRTEQIFVFVVASLTLIQPSGAKGISEFMCRNIKPLFNFEPPATGDEVRAASLQFVRKISGFTKPSQANESAFYAAVDEIARIAGRLLDSLEANAAPKNREEEAAKARARSLQRFGS